MEGRSGGRHASHSLVNALRTVPSLSSCDEPTLLAIVGDSTNLFWRAGSSVFRRDSPSDGLYIVVSGSVQVVGEAGEAVATLGPGDYFGEVSLLVGTAHQHEVLAAEDTELMIVTKERFEALLAGNPALAEDVRREAERRSASTSPSPPPAG